MRPLQNEVTPWQLGYKEERQQLNLNLKSLTLSVGLTFLKTTFSFHLSFKITIQRMWATRTRNASLLFLDTKNLFLKSIPRKKVFKSCCLSATLRRFVLFMCSKWNETGCGSSATSSHQRWCYIISQEDFKGLYLNLLHVTAELSFCYQISDEQLFTTLVFSPTSLCCRQGEAAGERSVGRKTLWWRAAKIRQSRFSIVEAKSLHRVWQLNVKKVQNCSYTGHCSPERTSESLCDVGGSADFVLLWQKSTDLPFVDILFSCVIKAELKFWSQVTGACLSMYE